jgi:hypothetical protein
MSLAWIRKLRGAKPAVGADADVRTVRSVSVARGGPRALSHEEFARLLKMPDRRTRQATRPRAAVPARLGRPAPLGSRGVGARRRRRASTRPRLRHAIKSSTIDTDHDGRITAEEHRAYLIAMSVDEAAAETAI